MIEADKYLKETLEEILHYGWWDENPRPKWSDGSPAYSKFVTHTIEKYNISQGDFPIPTLRPTAINTGIKEILWIYQKQSNCLFEANSMGINWWDDFDVGNKTIGTAYGYTVKELKLIERLLYSLEKNPFSRRHIMNLWYEPFVKYQDRVGGLNPCAYMTTWSVTKLNKDQYNVDVLLNIRSSDYLTAAFINRCQYVALAQMICSHLTVKTGIEHKVGKLTVVTANAHIYDRHVPFAKEILSREGSDFQGSFKLKENKLFFDISLDDWVFDLPETKPLSEKLEIAV